MAIAMVMVMATATVRQRRRRRRSCLDDVGETGVPLSFRSYLHGLRDSYLLSLMKDWCSSMLDAANKCAGKYASPFSGKHRSLMEKWLSGILVASCRSMSESGSHCSRAGLPSPEDRHSVRLRATSSRLSSLPDEEM